MIREETLREVEQRTYEEPDGDIIEVMSVGKNTMTVITRVEANEDTTADDSEKAEDSTQRLFDPSEMTVSELRETLDDSEFDDDAIAALLAAEQDGKNRTTAIDAIEDEL